MHGISSLVDTKSMAQDARVRAGVYGEDAKMNSLDLEVHPVYGPIPYDGDTVQCGEVLGLSPDGGSIIAAPISGTVRICRIQSGDGYRTVVRIIPDGAEGCSYSDA